MRVEMMTCMTCEVYLLYVPRPHSMKAVGALTDMAVVLQWKSRRRQTRNDKT